MKRGGWTAVTAAVALSSLPASAQIDAAAVAAEVRDEVVTLLRYDDADNVMGMGSGFFLPDGRIATSLHVVRGGGRVDVLSGGAVTIGSVEAAEAISEEHDLAILPRVDERASGLAIRDGSPAPGEPVVVIGAPRGLSGTISTGVVSAIREEAGIQLLQISAPISPGSSGGPVLDADGRVIGVITSSVEQGQNLNFAAPGNSLAALFVAPASGYVLADLATLTPPPGDESLGQADWVVILESGSSKTYLDLASFPDPPNRRIVVARTVTFYRGLRTPLGLPDAPLYDLETRLGQFDCATQSTRLLEIERYRGTDRVYRSNLVGSIWHMWQNAHVLDWNQVVLFQVCEGLDPVAAVAQSETVGEMVDGRKERPRWGYFAGSRETQTYVPGSCWRALSPTIEDVVWFHSEPEAEDEGFSRSRAITWPPYLVQGGTPGDRYYSDGGDLVLNFPEC